MTSRPVILDCDPGIDDAVALLLAAHAPELELCAVTTVAGNVGLHHTTKNAAKILTLAGAPCVVCPGADHPLFGAPVTADEVHGADGLLGYPMPEPAAVVSKDHAWDKLYQEAVAHNGRLEVIATGPLTNLAIAFSKYAALPQLIHRIILMGGAATFGNATPAAEFNMLADPEAAEMVFRSGVPTVVCGLDVTHRAYLTAAEIDCLEAQNTPQARFAAAVMRSVIPIHERYGVPGSPMHDACAMMYALDESLFASTRCWMGVERQGRATRGKTVTDLHSDAKRTPNINFVTAVDREKFVAQLLKRFAIYRECSGKNFL